MQNKLLKKGLVVGIIVLFISMSSLTSVSSKDIYISKDKILEDNLDIEPLDTNKEIYTRISGYCDNIGAKRIGIFVHFDVELRANIWGLTISGIRFPFNPFKEDVNGVNVPCFIGIIYMDRYPYHVDGFTFGNIEWS